MLNSNERMGFIIEYMSSYDEKIKMANKNGLFDAAKMFELFAIEVCNVWFGQKFSNLNDETATYPYVDLISENRELLVQVSTVQDVPTKIKTTLEKIRDSKDKKCSDLKNIVFFVLSNNSIDKVREYSGDNQIGSISFTIKDNLITTNDIITKAQNDLNFQKKLYKVLKDEYENFNINIRKFKGALELSNSGLKNIEGLINGEYEIDRNEFLEKITKDNERYISIQGGAGSGKSVLCKKYVENEKLVLYARAERFLEESHIDDIWGCCIQDVLECINGKKLIFFIDALEFIADCAETKFELLQYLYDMAAEYQNVYIVTSCRTSDKNAFIKLETNFSIKIYEVGDITEDELALLMKQYPIIHKMYKTNSYVDLLKSPFYINLIVSNSMDIDNIGDENSLREYIWKNIICLEEKSRMYGILSNKVIETVEKIVFERARKFMLGIHKDDIDRDIMHALLSEGVIAQQGDYIRLKYDIFEDICFEHYFDKAFDLCKGKYKTFYDEIENLGRCVYRRYQIWISNKMFIQVNRDKFLYSLTFSDEIPQSWKRQTEIGIVKSRFCDNYFEEQGSEILEQGMLFDFVKNINLFAFEGELLHIRQESPQMKLSPIGNGRPCIIRLLKNEEIYKKNIIGRDDIVKLCLDYAKQEDKVAVIASDACAMMEYYVEYESLSGLVPIYDHSLVILADEDEEVQADIAICKSNSGISGSRLAAAHVRLGEKIGRHIAAVFSEKNTSILVLERGGRFFGDGVYIGAGGIFYSMNPKQDDAPVINTERVVIVDSVINTGKSILRIIDEIKNHNPGIDVIIAANVIQNEAVELFKDYLVFATRLSRNSFVGVNQSKQTGKIGPDTADRLFNLIEKRY